jgi:hypothetical protein
VWGWHGVLVTGGSLSRRGDYRLSGGRLKDALRAPLRKAA